MNNQPTPRIIIKHGDRSYWQRPTISPSIPCRDCCFRGITKDCECPQGFPPCAPAKGRGATAMTFEDVTDSPQVQDAQAASGDVSGMATQAILGTIDARPKNAVDMRDKKC